MKLMLVTVLHLVLVVSLTHGAAIAAVDSAEAASSGQNVITAGGTSSRTARQHQQLSQPLSPNVIDTNNEPIFRTQPGFPAVFQPGNNDYQLKTSGNFAIADSGVIFWSVAGILGLILGVWAVSLFTGIGFFKTLFTGFSAFKGRTNDMGFKVDSQQLNVVANQVYKAIDTWRLKNKNP